MIHPSEEDIAAYVSDVSDAGRGQLQEHVEGCPQCRDGASEYEEIIESLSSRKTWGIDEPHSTTLESISGFDARWQSETREAALLMAGLKNVPFDQWPLHEFPRTPAMILEVLKRFRSESEKRPIEALCIANAAEAIAAEISEQVHGCEVILQIRGKIAKERALAFRYLGRFDEALASLDDAECLFSQLANPTFEKATVDYSRASVLIEMDRFREAIEFIDQAEPTFELLGMTTRIVNCRILRAGILYYMGHVFEARTAFSHILNSRNLDQESRGYALGNLASCHLELGEIDQALELSSRAGELFSARGNRLGATNARWAFARATLAKDPEEGISMLKAVAAEFFEMGMATDSALATLFMVEHSINRGDYDEAARLCTMALEQFVAAHMPMAAATAMTHLRELAKRTEATTEDIGTVRTAITESPRQVRQFSFRKF